MAKDEVGVDPGGLHKAGRTISGREGGAKTAAKALRDGIDSAGGLLGDGRLKAAARKFVDNHITDHANKLPLEIDKAGITTSNVASTARDADESGARAVRSSAEQLPMRSPNAPRAV